MQDDGVETESVEEREREGKVVKLVGQDSTANPARQLLSVSHGAIDS